MPEVDPVPEVGAKKSFTYLRTLQFLNNVFALSHSKHRKDVCVVTLKSMAKCVSPSCHRPTFRIILVWTQWLALF